ncbi:hypothetical protein CLOSTASPAR_01126 [[Clostridium] asparagiforme DSM 15981]|uniref:Uncharacterized protein n=1 Tax=[Clostridium] asparagiforme DSM 15981 TaxID=518636 RepID=C0CVX2_9FIRM|nr:hypothetical protein CLOSTASPAR_01126 [[Clostridium] asparagiforme DSM 15981]
MDIVEKSNIFYKSKIMLLTLQKYNDIFHLYKYIKCDETH